MLQRVVETSIGKSQIWVVIIGNDSDRSVIILPHIERDETVGNCKRFGHYIEA